MIQTDYRCAGAGFTVTGRMNPVTRLLAGMVLPLQRSILRRRLGRVVIEVAHGVPILVLPETFNPVVFRSGAVFAAAIRDLLAAVPGRSPAILDMGTGSGIGAVFAARAGGRVTAVDINPNACRCARINAAIHGLEERIRVLEGDLFSPVSGEKFDIVIFNPPFFRGTPKGDLDRAWRSEDVLDRFAKGVGGVLAPGGRVWVVLSSHGEGDRLIDLLREEGFAARMVRQRDFGTELMTVCEAWRVKQ